MPTVQKGQPIDQRTEEMGWPLPHIDNWQEDDVPRLRQALIAIDSMLHSVTVALQECATSSELAAAVNALQLGVNNLSDSINALQLNKVGVVNGLPGPAVTLEPEHLKLGPANGPESITISYDSQGRASSMTQKFNGKTATTTLGYDSQGRVAQVQAEYNGRTRTETLSYDPQGRLSGTTAVEVLA